MHEVNIDQGRRLIRLTVSGFLQPEEITRLQNDMKAAANELRRTGAQFDVLADIREAQVLTPEGAEGISTIVKWLFDHGLRKNVNLVSSALLKMQVGRLTAHSAHFDKEEDALRWLES